LIVDAVSVSVFRISEVDRLTVADVIVTSSADVGTASLLQFRASVQFVVPAPPSQETAASRVLGSSLSRRTRPVDLRF
jgi:hypothetical protein